MTMTEEEAGLQTLTCIAGHTWTREWQRGVPAVCPKHLRFTTEPGPKVPEHVLVDWRTAGARVEEEGYVERWTKFWRNTARVVAMRGESWKAVDLDLLEEYVRHCRLAEFHRKYAEDEPYYETGTGMVRAHPGWANAQMEEVSAGRTARLLGLLPEAPRPTVSGVKVAAPEDGDEDEDALVDDQVGPDGLPL